MCYFQVACASLVMTVYGEYSFSDGFYYMPVTSLSICRALLTQIDYHVDKTDAIFLPLTRAWGGEGCDEAVGGGRVVTRAGRARIDDWCGKSARLIA